MSCCNNLHVLETFCGNLCLSNRVLSPQGVAQIQSDLILCDLLWRQNFVSETETFTKKFSRTHKVTCSCDLSPQRVAATCRLVCSALKTFAAFHSGEHTQWNEVEAWADSFIQISEFCQPPSLVPLFTGMRDGSIKYSSANENKLPNSLPLFGFFDIFLYPEIRRPRHIVDGHSLNLLGVLNIVKSLVSCRTVKGYSSVLLVAYYMLKFSLSKSENKEQNQLAVTSGLEPRPHLLAKQCKCS